MQEQRAVAATGPGCRHLERTRALGEGQVHGPGLRRPARQDPDLARGIDGREGERHAHRRRLGRPAHRRRRAASSCRAGWPGNSEATCASGPMPEQHDVHGGRGAVVLGTGRGGQRQGVGLGGRVDVGVRAPRARNRMHAIRADGDVVEQRGAGTGLVAVGVALRQVPLVTPPDVHLRPVDRVTGRAGGDGGQHRGADAAARQAQVGTSRVGQAFDQAGDEPARHRLCQRRRVGVPQDVDGAHGAPTWARTSP